MMESNYEQLVKALRYCSTTKGMVYCNVNCKYGWEERSGGCKDILMTAAAAAIEALQAQLPKRGEWIKHPEVKNIYGGVYIECPFCGEKYVVQYIADEKFCRNCGADMSAKMEEVQE